MCRVFRQGCVPFGDWVSEHGFGFWPGSATDVCPTYVVRETAIGVCLAAKEPVHRLEAKKLSAIAAIVAMLPMRLAERQEGTEHVA
jgi:hypothetical protein